MDTKLTLTLEQNIIIKAKIYAKKNKRSLSDLIENYLKSLTYEEENVKTNSTPIVDSLRGSFKNIDNLNYKEELRLSLEEKYLK